MPENNKFYQNVEIARHMCELPKKHGVKGKWLEAAREAGHLLATDNFYYQIAKKFAIDPRSVQNTDGRPQLVATWKIDAVVDEKFKAGGVSAGYHDMELLAIKCKQEEMERKGIAGEAKVSKNTVSVTLR